MGVRLISQSNWSLIVLLNFDWDATRFRPKRAEILIFFCKLQSFQLTAFEILWQDVWGSFKRFLTHFSIGFVLRSSWYSLTCSLLSPTVGLLRKRALSRRTNYFKSSNFLFSPGTALRVVHRSWPSRATGRLAQPVRQRSVTCVLTTHRPNQIKAQRPKVLECK